MKKFFTLSVTLLMLLSLSISAFSVEETSLPDYTVSSPVLKDYVVDDADLLTDEQEAELQKISNRINFYHDIDAVIHTTNDLDGYDVVTYADDFYDYSGYSDDGLVFTICLETRDYYTSTTGYAETAFYGNSLESLHNAVVGYLSDGDYYTAFHVYLTNVDGYLESIHNESELGFDFDDSSSLTEPTDILKRELITIGVAFVVSFLIIAFLKSRMNTAVKKTQANDYLVPGSLQIVSGYDYFITSSVVRTPKANNNSSGGGTHRSSSGRSHGGGGGKF
ncbi:MAG: TPM domain-containing protein [Clostridia bacterium]|nr:TPM domain-containing protein [Clostridia bacterium]